MAQMMRIRGGRAHAIAAATVIVLLSAVAGPARAEEYAPRLDRIRAGMAASAPPSTLVATTSPRISRQDMPRAVNKKDRDPLWNGILIGLGAGIVTGIVITRAECGNDRECRVNGGLVVIPISAAVGATVGGLFDALSQ